MPNWTLVKTWYNWIIRLLLDVLVYNVHFCSFLLILYFASTPQCRPEVFKSTNLDDSNGSLHKQTAQAEENELESSDDEGLPPIEANTNRIKPFEAQSDVESDSNSDADS